MIAKDDLLDLVVSACPSFKPRVDAELDDWLDERDQIMNYIMLGAFAKHLITLLENDQTAEFGDIFEMVERLYLEGDDYVKGAATIGLLESIQNIALSKRSDIDPAQFEEFLRPETKKLWQWLNDYWGGKKPEWPSFICHS